MVKEMVENAPAPDAMPFALRPMEARDVVEVAEIEREAFPTTWPPTPFRKELSNRLARYLVAWERLDARLLLQPPAASDPPPEPGLLSKLLRGSLRRSADPVVEAPRQPWEGMLPGYVGIWFLADEAHITSIASRERYRGKGVGELLLIGSIELALLRGARVVTLEVRVSNEPAKALYRKYHFQEVGVRKNYYSDNNEDAYVMTTDPIASPAYQERFLGLMEQHTHRWGRAERVLVSPSGP